MSQGIRSGKGRATAGRRDCDRRLQLDFLDVRHVLLVDDWKAEPRVPCTSCQSCSSFSQSASATRGRSLQQVVRHEPSA